MKGRKDRQRAWTSAVGGPDKAADRAARKEADCGQDGRRLAMGVAVER